MTDDISYAQNMEDIHLAAIFAGQREGFYIDVGGGHPVADNVSFRSYLDGWRGIVVEPQAGLARLYPSLRPRDVVIDGLVGRTPGMAEFHVVDRLHGFSTTIAAHAEGAATFGADYVTIEREMTTLGALCAAHAPARIDWLKVDVEGAEAEVLAGNDWARFRPRVVVVEAMAPGSMEPAHADWEPILTGAGYRFAFFDNLNRFYLAEEAAELGPRVPQAYRDWGSVAHLYQFGRAPERADHPDHALASALAGLDPAALPLTDPEVLFGFIAKNLTSEALSAPADAATVARFGRLLLGGLGAGRPLPSGPTLEAVLRLIIADDGFRAALGRIAAPYDGGLILES